MHSQTFSLYKSPRRRAQWAIGVFVLLAVISLVSILFYFGQVDVLQRIKDNRFVSMAEAELNDNRINAIGIIQLILAVVSAVTFLLWLRLSYRNLFTYGVAGLRYSPNWTWLSFIISILSFVRPYQVAAEIWKASDPTINDIPTYSWQQQHADSIVKWWWGSFLLVWALGRILMLRNRYIDTLDQYLQATQTGILFEIGYILAIGITILFIWSLSQRQEQKHVVMMTQLTPKAA